MDFLKFFLAGLYLGLPFGPVGILCMGNTIEKGRKVGFISAMGAVTVDIMYGIVALFLLTPAQNFINTYEIGLKIGVGIFLAVIGLSKLFGKINITGMQFEKGNGKTIKNDSANNTNIPQISLIKEYRKILLISLSNVFNFVGIFAIFANLNIAVGESFLTLKLIVGILGAGALCWFITTTILNEVRKTITEKNIKILIRVCGAGIVILGLAFFVQGIIIMQTSTATIA